MSQKRDKKDPGPSLHASMSMSSNVGAADAPGSASATSQRPASRRASVMKAAAGSVGSRASGQRPPSFMQIGRSSTSRASTGTRQKSGATGGMDFSAQQALVTIYDNDGNDVTPKPLLSIQRPTILRGTGMANSTPENSTPTSEVSETATGGRRKESYRGPASLSGSEGTVTPDRIDDEMDDNLEDTRNGMSHLDPVHVVIERGQIHGQRAMQTVLHEQELDKKVYLTLSETDTFTLLHMPSRCVLAETDEARQVEETNQRYEALVEAAASSDTLTANEAQTLNLTMKNREVQVTAPLEAHASSQATLWDINDNHERASRDSGSDVKDGNEDGTGSFSRRDAEGTKGTTMRGSNLGGDGPGQGGPAMSRKGSVISLEGPNAQEEAAADAGVVTGSVSTSGQAKAPVPLGNIPGLYRALRIVERAVAQNTYNDSLLTYRNYQSYGHVVASGAGNLADSAGSEGAAGLPAADPSAGPSLQHLWSFTCDLTSGRNISSMCWNRYKRDLLAVGYGQFQFGSSSKNGSNQGGLVAFWSLKNPEYPEWTFRTSSPITALDFSAIHPNLLAVGFYDGSIAIYDVRAPEPEPKPVLESTWSSNHNSGKHSDPVWGLHWGDSNGERGETLVSISTDGRVTQWSIKKGLEHTDLMRLKRISHSGTKGNSKNEAFISRRSSGMCLDFSHKDSSMYIAGTEDGTIHKCSCSYAEQYLESFFGHTGPVYQVAWSPYSPSLFLSCSADWTIRLWSEDQSAALLTLQSGNESVSDIAWLPLNSTVFGAVTGSGKLEIWDVNESILKPQVTHSFASTGVGVSLSKLLFSQTAPVVVCGGSDGAVHVLRHRGLDLSSADPGAVHSSMAADSAGGVPSVGTTAAAAVAAAAGSREEMARRLDDAVQNVQQTNELTR